MKKVRIYFAGGTSVEFTKCDSECISNLEKWLVDDKLKVFKINGVGENKETLIRKDLVLLVDII